MPDVVGVGHLCEMLGIGKKTAYALLKNGSIPYRKIGRVYKIRKSAVKQFIRQTNNSSADIQ